MPAIRKTLVVALATAGLLALSGAASAMEAAAKSAVNVRTGPGTGFSVVDKLEADEVVDITECAPSGWCFIEHSGPDGWVSSSFLVPADEESDDEESSGSGANPDCGFGFSVGPSGPSLTVNCGDAAPPPPSPPPAADDEGDDEADGPQACFYVDAGFDGASFCMAEGTKNSLNNTFKDKITSVEVSGGLKAKLCVDNNLGGYCKTVTSDTDDLPSQIDNKANSILVFTGVGALLSNRFADNPKRALPVILGALVALTVFYRFALSPRPTRPARSTGSRPGRSISTTAPRPRAPATTSGTRP